MSLLKIVPIREKKIESDFPPRHETQGFAYTNRIGETVRADDTSETPKYGKSNMFGIFRNGKRHSTYGYDEAKSEYDYEKIISSKRGV